jgi:transcriptional regulator with XRE-family HTH domain
MPSSSQIRKVFAQRMKAARVRENLSQTALADRIGLLPSAVCHFENARRTPSAINLIRIADALQVSADFLLGREANK